MIAIVALVITDHAINHTTIGEVVIVTMIAATIMTVGIGVIEAMIVDDQSAVDRAIMIEIGNEEERQMI